VVPPKLLTVNEDSVVLLETTREPRVAAPTDTLFVTVNELRVVVPAGTLNPPLETVTLPPVDGLRIMLLLDATKRFPLALTVMDATLDGAFKYAWAVRTPRMKAPSAPVPPTLVNPNPDPPPPPDPEFASGGIGYTLYAPPVPPMTTPPADPPAPIIPPPPPPPP